MREQDRTMVLMLVALCFGAVFAINVLADLVEPINRRFIRIWQKLGGRGDGGSLLLLVTICLSPLYLLVSGICRFLGIRMPFDDQEVVRGPHDPHL